jgi:hypothetical protein
MDEAPAGDGALYWGNKRLMWGAYFLHWRFAFSGSDSSTLPGLSLSSGDTLASGGLAGDGIGQSSVGLTLTGDSMVTS